MRRLLWLLIVLVSAGMAGYWSMEAYTEWQEFPILTSVKTTGLPVTQIDYPAITICSQGSSSQVFRYFSKIIETKEFKKLICTYEY